MRSILLSLTLLCVVFLSPLQSQPQLSVALDIPPVTVDASAEDYAPRPLPVTVTIYNTGSSASASLTARIRLVDGLSLDSAEQSAMIKSPAPAVVAAGDSATVTWNIRIAPVFSITNYRVYVWLKYGASDSLQQTALLTVPAMDPPDLQPLPTSVSALALRQDSLGYQPNPFDVNVRFSNMGGTTADSVSLALLLPPDYELDPSSQDNPYRWSQPFAPRAAGGPREYLTWKVRYTGATRAQRFDTLRLLAKGKNRAGEWMSFNAELALTVEGMVPVFDISFVDPGAMQLDTGTIYRPHPYRLTMRLTNDSEQWTQLSAAELALFGDGVAAVDPLMQSLPSLAPLSYVEVSWKLEAERRAAPRQVAAEVTVADAEGKLKKGVQVIAVPGQPYALTIENFTAPDSLARNAEGTALMTRAVPLSFAVGNDTWYNSRVRDVHIFAQGTGIEAPTQHTHAPNVLLQPGAATPVLRDTFYVEPALQERVIGFRIEAVSDRGDTARAMRSVRVPAVQPLLELTRSGPDRLDYVPGTGYTPNPFAQVYTLRNLGSVTVRMDSIVLSYHDDGVATPQPLRRDIGWMLEPGDSLVTRWDFAAAVRDTLRRLPFTARAYFAREHQVLAAHTLEIPALAPVIDVVVEGPDTLAYDPDNVYDPNPFTRTLRIRNGGTAPLLLDSIVLRYDDPLLSLLTDARWTAGATVQPDSTIAFDWTMQADAHDIEKDLELVFAIHHGGGKQQDVMARVFIPALRPGLKVTITGNHQLLLDEEDIYLPDPFTKTVRIENTGTAGLQLDSVRVAFTDPLLHVQEGSVQVLGEALGAGQQREVHWHFHTDPHASQGYVLIDFTLHHSGGESLLMSSTIFVPGEPFAFRLSDVQMADRLEPREDGQGYGNNPVVLSYAVENSAWFSTIFTRAEVQLEGEGAQMLTQQPSIPGITLAARERSATVRDSFFVLPASFDRTIRVLLTVDGGNRGLFDRDTLSLFVPRIATTDAEDVDRPVGFGIEAMYPNPVRAGTSAGLYVRVRTTGSFRWEILDLLGRSVRSAYHSRPAAGEVIRIDVGGLQLGRYLLRVSGADGIRIKSFVILK